MTLDPFLPRCLGEFASKTFGSTTRLVDLTVTRCGDGTHELDVHQRVGTLDVTLKGTRWPVAEASSA